MNNEQLLDLLREARDSLFSLGESSANAYNVGDRLTYKQSNQDAAEIHARIDAALAEKQPKIEWEWAEGGWCEETSTSLRVRHIFDAKCWSWGVSGNALTEDEARRIASKAARSAK